MEVGYNLTFQVVSARLQNVVFKGHGLFFFSFSN